MRRIFSAMLLCMAVLMCCSCGNDTPKLISLSRFERTEIISGPYYAAAVEYDKKAECVERLIDKVNSLDKADMLPFPDEFKDHESVIIQSYIGEQLYMYIICASDDGVCTLSGGLNEAGADEHYRFSFVWDDAASTLAEINAYINQNQ